MNWRWVFSLLLATTIHLAWLSRIETKAESETPAPGVPDLIVAEAEPVLPPTAPAPPQPDPPEIEDPEPLEAERFRPNQEPEEADPEMPQEGDETEVALEESPAEPAPPEESLDTPDSPEPSPVPLPERPQEAEVTQDDPPLIQEPAKPKPTKEEIRRDVTQYRQKLMGQFEKQYTQVPELHTTVQDQALIPSIDQHFGITTLAYSFIDHKPGPPFILFEETHHQKLEDFDFSSFSNRIKDRMLYRQYRDRLNTARQQHGIHAMMKMIGLVPSQTDRYFSAKQLRAVQLAGQSLERVQATHAHYESHGADGFTLIVDSVVTKDGRVIPIQDEELEFSHSQDS